MTFAAFLNTDSAAVQKAPDRIYGWLDGQLSIARHYGGITYKGHAYVIDLTHPGKPEHAPLVKVSVLAAEAKFAKAVAKAVKAVSAEKQGDLL